MSTRKKQPEPDDKEQADRFIEAAKKIDEPLSKKAFEEVSIRLLKETKSKTKNP